VLALVSGPKADTIMSVLSVVTPRVKGSLLDGTDFSQCTIFSFLFAEMLTADFWVPIKTPVEHPFFRQQGLESPLFIRPFGKLNFFPGMGRSWSFASFFLDVMVRSRDFFRCDLRLEALF